MKKLKCRITENEKVCRFEAVGETEEEAKNALSQHISKKHKEKSKGKRG